MSKPEIDPERLVEIAKAKHKISVVRLQDELDALIKIFSHMREAYENEMQEGLGYKKMALTPKMMAAGVQLSKMMTDLVGAKIKYDKAAKAMADQMTPEEERLACLKYVQSLSVEERSTWVNALRMWMKARKETYYVHPEDSKPPE